MFGNVIDFVIHHHGIRIHILQIVSDIWHRIRLHHNIGFDTATIAHDATVQCMERLGQRIRHARCIRHWHVDSLSPEYICRSVCNIICREFETSIIRQVHRHLQSQSFSVSAGSQYHRPVQILQTSARYLTGTCGIVIHEYHNRHHRVDRLHHRLVIVVPRFSFPLFSKRLSRL